MRQHTRMVLHRLLPVCLLMTTVGGCERAPMTYAANCATPLPRWGREKDGVGHLRIVQPVYVGSDGSILWNKVAISSTTLRRYMTQMSSMNPEPQMVLDVSPAAACSRVEAIRAIMNASPLCRGAHSLCSEGANWRQWPELGGP